MNRSLSAWYAACAGAVALNPWLAVLLTDTGWTAAQVSALLVTIPALRLVVGPLWAFVADRRGPERVLRAAMLAGVLGSALLLVARGPGLVFVAVVAWALSRAPVFPIVDATTVTLVGRRYGRIRAAGSAAFLAVVATNGLLRDAWAPGPVALSLVLAVLALALTFRLPPLVAAPAPPSLASLAGLARHPVLVPLVVVCVLHGATLSTYDHLFALHVESLGLPAAVTGAALATGVGAEVVVLALGERLLRRLGPMAVFVLAVASGVPRFWLTGRAADPLALVAIQAFHGLHFGAFWIAGTAMFAEQAPPDLRHSTQALLPVAAFGAGPLIGLVIGSVVLSHGTTSSLYTVMAAVSALAAGLAGLAAVRRAGD